MCGLVGMAGKIDMTMREKIFPDMLRACSARGLDSSGAFTVHERTFRTTGYKMLGGPCYLLDSRQYENLVEKSQSAALFGHCRSRTIGSANEVKNAHPFDFPNVVGMHNGTLTKWRHLPKSSDFDVDSEALYSYINEKGIDEALSKVDGAYALSYYDKTEQTVNFIRNNERPLYFMWSENGETIFWASEPWMFGAVTRRIKPKILDKDSDNPSTYVELPINELWTIKLGMKSAYGCLEQFSNREIIGGTDVPVTHGAGFQGGSHYGQGNWNYSNGQYTRHRRANTNKGGEGTDPFLGDPSSSSSSAKSTTNSQNQGKPSSTTPPKSDANTPSENRSTNASSTNSRNRQLQKSDQQRHSCSATNLVTQLNLLPPTSSTNSPSTNRSGVLDASGRPLSMSSNRWQKKVSVRDVLGTKYIACKKTSHERTEEEFDNDTKSECCYCNNLIGDMNEVFSIIDKNRFICTSCTLDMELRDSNRKLVE